MVKFVSYDGEYPNLCSGLLVVEINGQRVEIRGLCSGGSVWFDKDWEEHVEDGAWTIFEGDIPEDFRQYKSEIEDVVNDNVPWGCCGGCV